MFCFLNLDIDISDLVFWLVAIIAVLAAFLASRSTTRNDSLLNEIKLVLEQNKKIVQESMMQNNSLNKIMKEYSALNIANELLKQRFEIKDLKEKIDKLESFIKENHNKSI